MKHIVCGGWLEIRTDPKNTAYVVTEGAKKRDTGDDKVLEGEIRIKTAEEREALDKDAFARLEGKVEDKRQAVSDTSRIEDLYRAKERDWDDPGEANKRLRSAFRVGRKMREGEGKATEDLKDRMSLGIDLLEETEEDRRRAGFVEFGKLGGEGAIVKARSKPLFGSTSTWEKSLAKRVKTTKAASEVEERKESLRRELGNNTRAVLDPFLKVGKPGGTSMVIPIKRKRKRKRGTVEENEEAVSKTNDTIHEAQPPPLVDYDSD